MVLCCINHDLPSPLCIIIGVILPVGPWLLWKKLGWSWLRYMNTAVLAANIGGLAGGTNGYVNVRHSTSAVRQESSR